MSSPIHKNEMSTSIKQRKIKTSLTNKTTSNMDTRSELADLIKRKAEISVSFITKLSLYDEQKIMAVSS